MWMLSLLFMSIGLSDLARSRESEPRVASALIATTVGAAPVVALSVTGGLPTVWLLPLLAVLVVWQISTSGDLLTEKLALLPVLALAVVVVAALIFPSSTPPPPAWFTDWYRDLPYWFAVTVSPERAALLIGYSLFLVNSANQVVVAVLTTAGSSVRHSVRSIRGGRIIGPIERLFILWMAVAGQALAIAVIVAAKGIVRYPEISEGSRSGKRRDRGALAEYVLIGSLVSWSLAFLMVPLY